MITNEEIGKRTAELLDKYDRLGLHVASITMSANELTTATCIEEDFLE